MFLSLEWGSKSPRKLVKTQIARVSDSADGLEMEQKYALPKAADAASQGPHFLDHWRRNCSSKEC